MITIAAGIFWTLWDEFPELEKEYTDLGLVLTTTYMMPPVQLNFHAADVVVATPADLQGKTMISLESYLADWLQILGASVEQPAFPDLFPMLESQAADGFAMHFNFLGGFDLVPALQEPYDLRWRRREQRADRCRLERGFVQQPSHCRTAAPDRRNGSEALP